MVVQQRRAECYHQKKLEEEPVKNTQFILAILMAAGLLTASVGAYPDLGLVEVEEIVVLENPAGVGNDVEGLNIRVDVANRSPMAVDGPIELRLYVRSHWTENWRLLKSWDRHARLGPQDEHTHNYFAMRDYYVDPALYGKHFELKAEVDVDGRTRSILRKDHDVTH